jgi:hypothetical protein
VHIPPSKAKILFTVCALRLGHLLRADPEPLEAGLRVVR